MDDIENNLEETEVEATDENVVESTRPIFNSLIDNEERSRYTLDMMK